MSLNNKDNYFYYDLLYPIRSSANDEKSLMITKLKMFAPTSKNRNTLCDLKVYYSKIYEIFLDRFKKEQDNSVEKDPVEQDIDKKTTFEDFKSNFMIMQFDETYKLYVDTFYKLCLSPGVIVTNNNNFLTETQLENMHFEDLENLMIWYHFNFLAQ